VNQMLIFKKDDKQKTKPILIRNMMQNTTSMIEKFPDAINCGGGDFTVVFFLTSAVNILAIYRYVWHDRTLEVQFNGDGTYRLEHSLNNYKHYTKGCINQSIQQLYIQGRAFNLVNDPTQIQQLQKQGEEIKLLTEEMQKLAKENRIQKEKNILLEKQIEQLNTKFDNQAAILEKDIQELQKSLPRAINSDDCFEILKKKDVKMCIVNTDTRVTTLEPSFTIAKSNSCIEGDIFDICIEKFELKGIVPCNDEEHIF